MIVVLAFRVPGTAQSHPLSSEIVTLAPDLPHRVRINGCLRPKTTPFARTVRRNNLSSPPCSQSLPCSDQATLLHAIPCGPAEDVTLPMPVLKLLSPARWTPRGPKSTETALAVRHPVLRPSIPLAASSVNKFMHHKQPRPVGELCAVFDWLGQNLVGRLSCFCIKVYDCCC